MTWDGMLPAQNCKQCGKSLNADGYHPAELYAGTFTGLCYSCERSGEWLINTAQLDGAETWEFPPHCPSWRRDRERFIGYRGCQVCGGKGRLWVGRADSQGGSYTKQCKQCFNRFWDNPLRQWEQKRTYPSLPEAQIRWAMEQEIESRLKDLQGTRRHNQYADAVKTAHERILFWLKDAPAYAVDFNKPESILDFMTSHRGASVWAVLAGKYLLNQPADITLAGTKRLS